jgi:ferric-dicitrate binding protein FerR (iron transport regulator)
MTPPDELISAHLDDALTPAQRDELTAWLKADPANLRRFVEANVRDQHLRATVQGRGELLPFEALLKVEPAPAPRRFHPWWAAAAAVLVLLVSVFAWRGSVPPRVLAEVVAADNAQLAGRASLLQPGDRVALRVVRLDAGTVRWRLPNDVVLDIAGPAEARFDGPMRLRVSHGKFTAEVGPAGKGFTIETAHARIVDLGTRFGVDASHGGATDVVVFEGHVEVYRPSPRRGTNRGSLITRLDAGEAVRVDQSSAPQRIVFIVHGDDEADWTARSEPPPGAVITHVVDNLGLNDSRRFYRVATGGMTIGVPARPMQRVRWFPYRGSEMPAWLEGADLVETFGLDKFEERFELSLTLARPALLCVFQDARIPAPEWLRQHFSPSGFHLVLRRLAGEDLASGFEPAAEVPFEVWTRRIHQPGTVTLGPPRSPAAGDRGRMYGVAAQPLTP